MKKLFFILLILQACSPVKNLQVVNYSNPKLLFFIKHSDNSNDKNKEKLKVWVNDLQKRYTDLYVIGKSFDINSSLDFEKQLQKSVKELNPKYVFCYNYSPQINYTIKNKYVFVLKDSSGTIIKDKVYNDFLWIALSDIAKDFEKLESLK